MYFILWAKSHYKAAKAKSIVKLVIAESKYVQNQAL